MASRVLQRCVRDTRQIGGITHFQVATKISNPLKKPKKKVNTLFVEKEAENITFRNQNVRKKSAEEEAIYRRAEIVANMKQTRSWITPELKSWIYDRLLNTFHIGCIVVFGWFCLIMYQEGRMRYKMYKFSQKVAKDLADELGMEKVPSSLPKKEKPLGKMPREYYYKDQNAPSVTE